MEWKGWRLRSGADPANWPHASLFLTTSASANSGDDSAQASDAVSLPSSDTLSAALLDYVQQWMASPPALASAAAAPANMNSDGVDDHTSSSSSFPVDGADTTLAEVPFVLPAAYLNALLVSLPPKDDSAASPTTTTASSLDSARRTAAPAGCVPAPTLIVSSSSSSLCGPSADEAGLRGVAGQLLRHSKWLASGVAHAAGPSPRLPSASLLADAYHHALLPVCQSPAWADVDGAAGPLPLTRSSRAAGDCRDGGSGNTTTPPTPLSTTSRMDEPSLDTAGAAAPTASTSFLSPAASSFRGCLVLLVFHRVRCVRVWARDSLLQQMKKEATSTAAATAAEGDLAALLVFATQLLCALKHCAVLPDIVSFTDTAGPRTASASIAPSTSSGGTVCVVQDRVKTVVDGVVHLLTVLTTWDAQFATAMERLARASSSPADTAAAAAAATPAAPALPVLLNRCRTTVVLLGGSMLLYSLHSFHQALTRGVSEAWASRHRGRPQDPKRTAQAALAHLLHPLNALLATNPRMPKPVAVTALTVRKTLLKVLVHCLLDSASGLVARKEEEAWRLARLRWLWSVAAALEPPTPRVAAPLLPPPSAAAAAADRTGTDTEEATVWVPERSAGWLLRALLKNAEQQFQWALAMTTAKAKPHLVSHDDAALLDRAVYGLYLLLESLTGALPTFMETRFFHDTVAAYESQLLTLAIGGIVHSRSRHALHLHRLLFRTDVRAFAAGVLTAEAPLPPPSPLHAESPTVSGTGGGGGGRSSAFLQTPTVCLQRVWLTLPTLLVQVCKTALPHRSSAAPPPTSSSSFSASGAAPLSLSHVVAALCGVLTELIDLMAVPCPQWLLLSPTEAMATGAPPPFQWVVQRCLRTLADTLRDHHDLLQRAWLGLPTEAAAAAQVVSPVALRAAAAATASRMLTEERDLLHFLYVLRGAAAADGGLRRLSEGLANIFCPGITAAVAQSKSAEATEWVWRRVVLTQPALSSATASLSSLPGLLSMPSSPQQHQQLTTAVMPWDVDSPVVANAARAQGTHWMSLLSECKWDEKDVWTVRCGWWMCALLADVVALDAEQRRVLADGVLLTLPTAPMLLSATSSNGIHSRATTSPNTNTYISSSNNNSDAVSVGEEGDGEDEAAPGIHSDEFARQEAADRDNATRLYNVAQRLFTSVLRKAEQYPRASVDRLLLHLSNALPAARVQRDAAFNKSLKPLLMRTCSHRPEVKEAFAAYGPPWLREWTAAAGQCVTANLAEQERRFRQFEMEEEMLRREEDNAARVAVLEAQARRHNEKKRAEEMAEERVTRAARREAATSSTATTTTTTSATSSPAVAADGSAVAGAVPRPLHQQLLLFPDCPLYAAPHGNGVKRERSPAESGGVVEVVDSDDEVVEWEVDSDEDVNSADTAVLDRIVPTLKAPKTEPHSTSTTSTNTTHPSTPSLLVAQSSSASPPPPPAAAAAGKSTLPPPPPTRLQQKLQAINARNTHRVHHAEQLRQLQDRLCRVAASTSLLHLQPPLIHDIIGTGSNCMAPTVPVLPEVFVSAAELPQRDASTSVTMPFGDAASVYAVRFAPHIALELRCDIVRNYEDVIEGVAKSAGNGKHAAARQTPPHGAPSSSRPNSDAVSLDETSMLSGSSVSSWAALLPVHPSIPTTCFAVHSVGTTTQAGSNAHDPLSFRFHVRATANPAVTMRNAPSPSPQQQGGGPRPVDATVRAVAEQGLSAGLSEGDVVVVLLPLLVMAEAMVERYLDRPLSAFPAAERSQKVRAALARLPKSWRDLGCLPQVCYVQSLLYGERTAQLCAYPSIEPRPSTSHTSHTTLLGDNSGIAPNAQPLRFVHAMRLAYSGTSSSTFYIKKLTSLNAFQMELAALHQIDHTRFAATLYDPRHAAADNGVYYAWITSLLSATTGPTRLPLLAQLRPRLLLQRQLNDWQLRAILAVLYATCPDWDESEAKKCVGAYAPRAPEVLLIEGPPGTGKTQTIGSLTLNVLHHLSRTRGANARVLVCAPSNCAVDEALLRVVHLREQLVKGSGAAVAGAAAAVSSGGGGCTTVEPRPSHNVLSGSILRVGIKDRVDAEVLRLPQPVFFDDVVDQRLSSGGGGSGGGRAGAASAKTSERMAVRSSTIESASIIFSTLGSLHRITRQVQGLTFDVVIVDEASQGTEPAVLQAVVLARSKCVLVGDSKQLQPTILSREASRCGLRRSLLVRMLACGHKSFLLRTQYRMHPDICAFPNAYFYDSKLETDRSVHLRARAHTRTSGLLSDVTMHDPSSMTVAQRLGRCPRFVFVDVAESPMERRRGRSLLNRGEAQAVVQYMRQLRNFLGISVREMAPQLGIITFYNAQKDTILSMLTREERQSGLQIATVDSFQGKEKRIILLSCVRTVRRAELMKQQWSALASAPSRPREDGGGGESGAVDAATFEERLESRRVGRFGLGFLADGHRLNVALTRAQDLCMCFGSRESLQAIEDAVTASTGRPAPPGASSIHSSPSTSFINSSTHVLTTTDSAVEDVVQQLDRDDEDPMALCCMLRHAEKHDVCRNPLPPPPPLSPEGSEPDSVEVVEEAPPAAPAAMAACVDFVANKSMLIPELTRRARIAVERGGSPGNSQHTQV